MKETLRKGMSLLLVFAMLFALTACGTAEPAQTSDVKETQTPAPVVSEQPLTTAPEEETKPRIVTDHLDREVEVPEEINRIVVCDIYPLPSVLSVFFDSAEKIVGMAQPSMVAAKNGLLSQLYPEILNAETGFIDGSTINMEELMRLNPDVVFFSASHPEQGDQLAAAGLPAIAISAGKWNYNAIETLKNWIGLIGQMFPENDKSEIFAQKAQEAYDLVQQRVSTLTEKEKVFFLFQYNETTLLTSGARGFGQWWTEAIGAENVATELPGENSAPVNMEQIYAWNPTLIFITNFTNAMPQDLYENTVGVYDWSAVDAVGQHRVYKMPMGMYRSYTAGVDAPVALLWLAQTAYPQLFEDIDVTQYTREYYQEIFGVELTDAQAASIFAMPESKKE